jgi:two-component system cell cycle response regulator
MVGDRDKVLSSGFDGYISKPINPEIFTEEVEGYLSSNHSDPHPPHPESYMD